MVYSGAVIKTIYHSTYFKDLVVTDPISDMIGKWMRTNADTEQTLEIIVAIKNGDQYEGLLHIEKTATIQDDPDIDLYTFLAPPSDGHGGIVINYDRANDVRGYQWLRFNYDEEPDEYLIITNFDETTCSSYGVEYAQVSIE